MSQINYIEYGPTLANEISYVPGSKQRKTFGRLTYDEGRRHMGEAKFSVQIPIAHGTDGVFQYNGIPSHMFKIPKPNQIDIPVDKIPLGGGIPRVVATMGTEQAMDPNPYLNVMTSEEAAQWQMLMQKERERPLNQVGLGIMNLGLNDDVDGNARPEQQGQGKTLFRQPTFKYTAPQPDTAMDTS